MSSLGSGTGAPAASAAAAASASTESAAATVAGKEEQEAIEDAAGSSSGGSETDRLPVWCGAVGSVQVTEAALTAEGMSSSTTSLRGAHALPGHKKIRAHKKHKATEYFTHTLSAWRALSSSSNVLLARLTFPAGAISEYCVGRHKTSSARESKTQDARRHGAESIIVRGGKGNGGSRQVQRPCGA